MVKVKTIVAIFFSFFFQIPFSHAVSFSTTPPPSPYAVPSGELDVSPSQKLPDFSAQACRTGKKGKILKKEQAIIHFLKAISDQHFIAVGTIQKDPWTNWIGKYDATGKVLWRYCFFSTRPMEDEIHDLVPTSDGGILAVGKQSGQKWQAWALKLDAKGAIQWQKTYGRPTDSRFWNAVFQSVAKTADGGYIVSGHLDERLYEWGISCGACDGHYGLLMKLNSEGTIEWQRTYGMEFNVKIPPLPGSDEGLHEEPVEGGFSFDRILVAANGDYLVAGMSNVFEGWDAWVARFDAEGNPLWQKQFGKSQGNMIMGMLEDADGNIVIAGWLKSLGAGNSWAMKLDPQGKVVWQKFLGRGAYNWMTGVYESSDKEGYVFLASATPSGQSPSFPDILWMFELDENGNFRWQKGYLTSLNMSMTHFTSFQEGYWIGSSSDLFEADLKGTIKDPPAKLLQSTKANFGSRKTAQQELTTNIHDYDIPLEEGEGEAQKRAFLLRR